MPYAVPFGAVPTRKQELEALREQEQFYESAFAEISKRINGLEAEKDEE